MAAKHPTGGRKDPPKQREDTMRIAPLIAAAKAFYESTPGVTFDMVAAELGVRADRVRKWKQKDAERGVEWVRNAYKAIPQLAEKAQALADTFTRRMSERGAPMSDEVAARETAQEIAENHAVNQRAAIIDRHRNEWAAPRKLAYEAIKTGNFDRAKLAKISAETLTLIQTGECRAYGIDTAARGNNGGAVVIFDRGAAPAPAVTAGEPLSVEEEAGAAADAIEMPAEVEAAEPDGEVTGDTSTSDDGQYF
jgi:hypothetical protein